MKSNKYTCYGQIGMFEYMESLQVHDEITVPRHKIGDIIGRLVLGEVEKGQIYEIEGNEKHFFYRTKVGCFNKEEGSLDIEALEREAEKLRKDYNTIFPFPLEKKVSIIYSPRKCDGYVLKAQLGIYQGMLYWKEAYTYEFLEPYNSEKELMNAYKKRLDNMTKKNINEDKWEEVEEYIPIGRLYWSKKGFYVNPRYVVNNG